MLLHIQFHCQAGQKVSGADICNVQLRTTKHRIASDSLGKVIQEISDRLLRLEKAFAAMSVARGSRAARAKKLQRRPIQ
jgi:hypothetical protein